MKKLNFEARTLDDEIVRDGLCAVGALENATHSKQSVMLVGGVATQSYLPSTCRRPTSDIDLAVLRPLNYTEFKSFSKEAVDYLTSNRYRVETKKGHNSFQLVFNDESGNASVIEFARRNVASFDKIYPRLQREFENARLKVVEERDSTYRASSPEDIVVPKIVRGIGSLKRHPEFFDVMAANRAFPLTEEHVKGHLIGIRNLRAEAILHIGSPELSEKLRFLSDAYDIQLLSEVVGFNSPYLNASMSDWDILKERSEENQRLVGYLFPNLQLS